MEKPVRLPAHRNTAAVRLLLKHGASLHHDVLTRRGFLPPLVAAILGDDPPFRMVALLLQVGGAGSAQQCCMICLCIVQALQHDVAWHAALCWKPLRPRSSQNCRRPAPLRPCSLARLWTLGC